MSVNSEIGTYKIPQTTNTKWESLQDEKIEREDEIDGMGYEDMEAVDPSEVKDVDVNKVKQQILTLQRRGSILSAISQKTR